MCEEEEEYSSIQVFAWDVELKSKMKIVSFLFFLREDVIYLGIHLLYVII